MTELKLPSLGEGIEKGIVISINVIVGDTIVAEQPLLEVETDKVVVEVPADSTGVVSAILVNLGDEITEGTPIISLDNGAGVVAEAPEKEIFTEDQNSVAIAEPPVAVAKPQAATAKVATKTSTQEIKLPSLGEGIEKGTVINIMVKEGDVVAAEQALMEVETDKVVVEVPADFPGTIMEILVNIGDEIGEGAPILKISSGANTEGAQEPVQETISEKVVLPEPKEEEPKPIGKESVAPKSPPITTTVPSSSGKRGFRASPLAKKIAREIGITLADIPVDQPGKRISVKDVKNYAKQLIQNRSTSVGTPIMALPDLSKWGAIRKEGMTGIMQATSKNMTTSWSQIPHAWLQEKVDITYLEKQRQTHKHAIKAKGGSLTITGILVKVMAKALQDFPIFNASIDALNNQLVYKDYINIGVAVDTDRGLLVPVLKNADEKNITDIALELSDLAQRVKQRKIGAADLEGGTFTISNLGGIGTSAIFPLVSFPQVAILGVAASQTEAVWVDNQFQPRLLMPLTIGFDHRIINGADAARFLQHVKNLLEDWFMWNI